MTDELMFWNTCHSAVDTGSDEVFCKDQPHCDVQVENKSRSIITKILDFGQSLTNYFVGNCMCLLINDACWSKRVGGAL